MLIEKIAYPESILSCEPLSGKELREDLAKTVRTAKGLKIPTVILFEGWGASGKGYMTEKLISELDPRGFKVFSTKDATGEEARYPMLRRFWEKLPPAGNLSVFDRSWYREVSNSRVEGHLPAKTTDIYFNDILEFERQLTDGGYVIIKFFLQISKKEQAARFDKLEASEATQWRVTKDDHKRNKKYDEYYAAFSEMIERTDSERAPWKVLDATDMKKTAHAVCSIVNTALKAAIEKKSTPSENPFGKADDAIDYALASETYNNPIPDDITRDSEIIPSAIKKLIEYDLTLDAGDNYKTQLKELQSELFKLHNKLYRKKIPLVIVFEGWDAAGKGGAIKRLTSGLDPRGYEVIPISAPTPTELSYHYLRRFWTTLPKSGHIGIYDRSWYGRVMVERLEGFAKRNEWTRAFDEINKFERTLVNYGTIAMKFWLQIDDTEQLKRFCDRKDDPDKCWKITDEDWRNRDKRLGYHIAVDQMLELTNTEYAPWFVVEANSKKYARIKVLETVINQIKAKI